MTLAVVPVLVGPLQTLLALLPAILVAIGTLLAALLTPRGMLRTARFFWHQKLVTLTVLALGACAYTGWPLRVFSGHGRVAGQLVSGGEGHWPMFRGGPQRTGVFEVPLTSPAGEDWSASDPDAPESVYASPAVAGQQLIFATAGGIGPFSPAGRGAIVTVDTTTGGTLWRYAPDDFRATFSSPVVTDGLVVCGEGLHLVHDARVTCLDLNGNRRWEFRTKSHVEATVCIDQGREYVAEGRRTCN